RFAKATEDNSVVELKNSSNARITAVQNEDLKINSQAVFEATDTLPCKIKSVDITADDHLIIIYNDDKAEKITKTEAKRRGIVLPPVKSTIGLRGVGDSVLYFLDGAEFSKSGLEKINPNDIES